MKQNGEDYSTLITALQNQPEGVSIQEVADLMGVHRNTAAKYLEVLQSRGEVDVRRIGVSKLFIASRRVPFACVIRLFQEPVIGIDRDLSIVELNDAAARLLGGDTRAFSGRPIWNQESVFGSEMITRMREIVKGKWFTWENENARSPYIIRGVPVKYSDSRIGAALILYDQNETQGMRAELERITTILRSLTDYQTEYIFHLTPDLMYGWVSPSYSRLFSLKPEQMAGTRFSLRGQEDEYHAIARTIRETPPEGGTIEYRIHLNGDIRYLQVLIHPVPESDPEGGYVCVGKDVTDLKLKEEQFQKFYNGTEELLSERTHELRDLNRKLYQEIHEREEIETRLRTVEFAVQHVADMILWFDISGVITYSNQKVHDILKPKPEPEELMEITRFIADPLLGDWETFWDTLRRKQTLFHETIISASDGETIPAEILFNYLKKGDEEYCCCIARDVQEQKQALAELIESENRFQQLAGTIPEVFFLRDVKSGSILYVNRAFEQVFDLPISRIYQDPGSWYECIHPDDRSRFMERINQPDQDAREVQYRIIRPDGIVRWLDIRIRMIRDADGLPFRDVGIIFDITDHKRLEEELKLLNNRLLTTLKATPVSAFSQDTELIYTWSGKSMLGLGNGDILGKTDTDLFLPDEAEKLAAIKRSVLDSGVGTHADVEITHHGRQMAIRMFIEPFRNAEGNIAGITGASFDLTDIFRVQEALRISEEKYRRLFEETNDICLVFSVIHDEQGEICDFEFVDLNKQALILMGREKREVIGRRISDFRPDIDPRWAAALRKVAQNKEQISFDGFSECYRRHISVNAYPTGEDRIGVIIRDISDLIRAHEQVEHQRDLALALAATDDLSQALALILDAGKQVPGIDSGGIYFVDEKDRCVYLHAHIGLSDHFVASVRKGPVTPDLEREFGTGEPLYIQADSPPVAGMPNKFFQEEGLKSVIALPILNNNHFFAVLNLGSHTMDTIPVQERPYLEALGAHLGETLARLRRGTDELQNEVTPVADSVTPSIQILDQDGRIIEGRGPADSDGFASREIMDLITRRKEQLLTGQEITHLIAKTGFSGHDAWRETFQVRIRFIPWGREVAYIAIWERSPSSESALS